jgi:hypothetical protein
VREISRGLHPAILSTAGLRDALHALARRCADAVEMKVLIDGRLSEPVEVGAHYVVSEMLTNPAKHARARPRSIRRPVPGFQLAGSEVGRLPGRPSHVDPQSCAIGVRAASVSTRREEAAMFTSGHTAASGDDPRHAEGVGLPGGTRDANGDVAYTVGHKKPAGLGQRKTPQVLVAGDAGLSARGWTVEAHAPPRGHTPAEATAGGGL